MNNKLIEVTEYNGIGYSPVVKYGEWRVAVLNYHPELLPQNIKKLQKHDKSDEVFVLLHGRCILYSAQTDEAGAPKEIFGVDMQPYKQYNIKKSVYHSHTLSEDAMVLIIENDDTCNENSPEHDLTPEQCKELCKLRDELWF